MFQSIVLANSTANVKSSGCIGLTWNIRAKLKIGLAIKFVYP
jgi:hypothetical protein